jgi:hypothetical protein
VEETWQAIKKFAGDNLGWTVSDPPNLPDSSVASGQISGQSFGDIGADLLASAGGRLVKPGLGPVDVPAALDDDPDVSQSRTVVVMEIAKPGDDTDALLIELNRRFSVAEPHHLGQFEVIVQDVADLEAGRQAIAVEADRINPDWDDLDCPRFRRHLTAWVERLGQGGVDATHQAAIPAGVPA